MEFAAEDWRRRVDHRLQLLWARIPPADRANQQINVLVKFSGPSELLPDLGLKLHAVAGDIASGAMMLIDLPQLAAAPRVRFVELARPLDLDR